MAITMRVITLACCLVALAALHHLAQAGDVAPGGPTSLTFYVYDRDPRGPIVGQAGVKCMLVRESGVIEVGVTSASGEIEVPYSSLFEPGNLAVLFCPRREAVQCTALRLDVPHLRGFAEYNVRVTKPEIVDRMRVGKGR